MKAIVINGSPRRNGNTDLLAAEFVKGLVNGGAEIEEIYTSAINIAPCSGCLYCESSGECTIQDDMQECYKKITESDIIIITSPIYFASVTAQLKTFIDRCQLMFSRKYKLGLSNQNKKIGYFIFTAGSENKAMVEAVKLLAKFFMLSVNAELFDMIYVLGTDKRSIKDNQKKLSETYEKGYSAAKLSLSDSSNNMI